MGRLAMHARGFVSAGMSVVVIAGVWIWLAARSSWRPTSATPFLAAAAVVVLLVVTWRALSGLFRR
jgi:hypothetical protein